MASLNDTITADRLRALIHYDPDTGVFTWLRRESGRWNTRYAGSVAGCDVDCGGRTRRRLIAIGSKQLKAHRLAWLYMTGEWPVHEIDHIDGDALNNRWSNLRQATHQQNRSNNAAYLSNKLGVRGVTRHANGRYRAVIDPNGKRVHLGYFTDLEDARRARLDAERRYFGEFAPARQPARRPVTQ